MNTATCTTPSLRAIITLVRSGLTASEIRAKAERCQLDDIAGQQAALYAAEVVGHRGH